MRSLFLLLVCIVPLSINAQEILEGYIRDALDNNLALKQREADYTKSIERLREAKGLFWPSVSLGARYTVSEGGRVIEFPVGDLLNPVYSTLNALTGSSSFPAVENQEIRFLRPTEHETRVRLIQPVFNTDIWYNAKISSELMLMGENDYAQYRRELVAEVKNAYYNLAMVTSVVKMLSETRSLLTENVRVSRKLIENGKAAPDFLYRSESELDRFDLEFLNARNNRNVAKAYFNFLLNRNLADSVIISDPVVFPSISGVTSSIIDEAIKNREEIDKLGNLKRVAEYQAGMNKADALPELAVAVDYGFQGEKYRFNGNYDYVQASAVLSWNIFSGWQKRAKIKQAELDISKAGSRLDEAKKQIELQVIRVLGDLKTAEQAIVTSESRLRNSSESFRLVSRRFGEGQASLLEFIDARSSLTLAEENLIVARYRYLSAYAEFEKVSASGSYK